MRCYSPLGSHNSLRNQIVPNYFNNRDLQQIQTPMPLEVEALEFHRKSSKNIDLYYQKGDQKIRTRNPHAFSRSHCKYR